MHYTPRIEQALKTAAWLHRDQVRKGPGAYPYITHPVAVATILAAHTDDENILIGALLHDTLEDTEYTEAQITEDFGASVAELVRGVSEWTGDPNARPSREERRERYIAALHAAPVGSLLISAADKIHNLRSMITDYHDRHQDFIADFGHVVERIAFYRAIQSILRERLGAHSVMEDFDGAVVDFERFARQEV